MAKKYKKYVTVGNDKGKPIRKWFYGDTITELKANIFKYKRMLENASNPSFITFGTYTEQWKDAWKSNKSAQTKEMYDITLDKFTAINKKKIMNKPFISVSTKKAGKIINIDKKHLTIDIERWQWEPVDIGVESYKNYIEVDENIQHSINDYLDTFDDERKLKRLISSLARD